MAANDESELLTLEDRAFARVLRAEREAAGWTQGELAQRLAARGLTHVSQVTISRIEHGKRAARLGEAEAIADAVGVPLALMTTVDERAEFAKSLMWRVASFQRLQVDAAELVTRLGEAWSELQGDYAFFSGRVHSELYEHVELPAEVAAAIDEYYRQAEQALKSPVIALLDQRFERAKVDPIGARQSAQALRNHGTAADAN